MAGRPYIKGLGDSHACTIMGNTISVRKPKEVKGKGEVSEEARKMLKGGGR